MNWSAERAFEFESLVRQIIENLELGHMEETPLPRATGPDIEFSSSNVLHIVECKIPGPQTDRRVREIIQQLHFFDESYIEQGWTTNLILAIPDVVSTSTASALHEAGITVWDGPWVSRQADLAGLSSKAAQVLGEESEEPHSPGDERAAEQLLKDQDEIESLLARLAEIPPGPKWADYQNLCREISAALFSPPLSAPLWERGNFSKTNRRDLILPNYALEGLWGDLRTRYQADYVVIDAKNYSGSIKKEEVLQIANYLQKNGLGLFAMIFTRVEPSEQLNYVLREQWILHDKMIVILTDSDVRQMLTNKRMGVDPAEVIRQKIEDFRVSL
ncbi:hypothetical protein ACTWJ8_18065 [Streptomyces sp. SDT5-1]|uniref:hypothetical protein n=1 Tax=Streptomyces sp. SDT5-1 TaxID=3406418 RepID=UPI003FD063E7